MVPGIDLGKNSCSVAGLDDAGCHGTGSRMSLRGCVVAMEACCGEHHVERLDRNLDGLSLKSSVSDKPITDRGKPVFNWIMVDRDKKHSIDPRRHQKGVQIVGAKRLCLD